MQHIRHKTDRIVAQAQQDFRREGPAGQSELAAVGCGPVRTYGPSGPLSLPSTYSQDIPELLVVLEVFPPPVIGPVPSLPVFWIHGKMGPHQI